MGEEALGIVGRPGDPGDSLPHGSHAARLFGLQGTLPVIFGHSILCTILDYVARGRVGLPPWNTSFLYYAN